MKVGDTEEFLKLEKHKKKKKERAHENEAMESMPDGSMEEGIMIAPKKPDKKKKKKKKNMTEIDETAVMGAAEELTIDSKHDVDSMKSDKKEKRKEKEFEAVNGNEGVSRMKFIGSEDVELGVEIDNKKKKKRRKDSSDEKFISSSVPEFSCGVNEMDEGIKDIVNVKKKKRGKSDDGEVHEGGTEFYIIGQGRESASVDRKKRSDKELELEENLAVDAKKRREKDRNKSIESNSIEVCIDGKNVIAEGTGRVDDKHCQGKGKRKRVQDGIEPEKLENSTGRNSGKVSSTEVENEKDGFPRIPSSRTASGEKSKRKKERKGGQNDKKSHLPEATAHKETNFRENDIATNKKASKDMINGKASSVRKEKSTEDSLNSESRKKSRRVSFSGKVQVFPYSNDANHEKDGKEGLIQGKRFTPEEDEIVRQAVFKYIEMNQLGEEGLHMVLNCKLFPQVKGCWKEIGASLPWRPYVAVYYRGHILFERSEKREWDSEEYEILRRHHEQHGADWKSVADLLGKHRFHVKDCWRRIKLSNSKRGKWSQDEYQALFDLVNLDLRMKAFEEKNTKHGMLRDNISWEAISQKLATRYSMGCCMKWYNQLTSPLVNEGLWADSDDYRLVDALQNVDACCVEDVDWDNLLEHRSGEICRKRWNEMVRHIGGHKEKSFIEQVEVLSKRYCPEMLEYRE